VETKAIIQSYLSGLFIEFVLVAVLNAAGLLLLGINYAILLGIIGALLNVIPYIGGIVAVALIMAVALVTKSGLYAVYALAVILFIQFIDNNYIIPKIIGSKVKLNSLICLVAVLLGDALWGIPGMFLSIPLTAIVKLIFDRIESLKPWGYLLGDTMSEPKTTSSHFTIKGFIQNIKSNKKSTS
jgi:predicted PurR-regulated permease PerM